MDIKRLPDRPQPASGPIKRFDAPAAGPHRNPPAATPVRSSNEVAAHAVRIAQTPGRVDPRQQRY